MRVIVETFEILKEDNLESIKYKVHGFKNEFYSKVIKDIIGC